MIRLKDLLKEGETLPNGTKANYFRAVDKKEMVKAKQLGHLPQYSSDPMSTDWEVIELSMQQNGYEGDPDEYVKQLVPWKPINKGVNITADFENAIGYGDYVLALDPIGAVVDFTNTHSFAKDPKQVVLLGIYNTKTRKWEQN
jgi:hypothetical protein